MRRLSITLIIGMLLFSVFISTSFAASKSAPKIFTETIKNTNIKTVQEAVYKTFVDAGFSPVGMFPDRVVMQKQFGDGYIAAHVIRTSTFITEQNGRDVILAVTQKEIVNGIIPRETAISYLLPFVKSVKTNIDGTPAEQITDETQDVADLKSGKKLGLMLGDKNTEGQYPITITEINPVLKKAGLITGDIILEVDLMPISGMSRQDAEKFINNKWEGCNTYLVMQIIHNGKQNIIKLRKDQVL